VPILVCHDEIVVERDAEQAADVKAWLEKAMVEGMGAVLHGTDEAGVPVEVEARIARSWEEGGWPYVQMQSLEESGSRSSGTSRSGRATIV
jgi:hypothetical protein